MTITTKAYKKDEAGSTIETRQAETNEPRVLQSDVSLQELVDALGEDYVKQKVQAQLMIDFRSKIRGQLEKDDDNGDPAVNPTDIESQDYTDWTPELRQKKSKVESLAERASKLSEEEKERLRAMLED